jgi:hypothetical protein
MESQMMYFIDDVAFKKLLDIAAKLHLSGHHCAYPLQQICAELDANRTNANLLVTETADV